MGVARRRGGLLASGAPVHARPQAIQPSARRNPTRPEEARRHDDRDHARVAGVLACRAPLRRGQGRARDDLAGEAQQLRQGARHRSHGPRHAWRQRDPGRIPRDAPRPEPRDREHLRGYPRRPRADSRARSDRAAGVLLDPGTRGRTQVGKNALAGFFRILDRLVAAGAPAVGTDPDPANTRAIRAYGKPALRPCARPTTQIPARTADAAPGSVRTSMTTFSPREIVSELDRFIVGQHDAKRAVAIALRNRWRRQQLEGPLREEVAPKNILMIGPTGCGKTEISRRLARLAGAPFLKVEATKFTEVGYVGRDVEQIVRDLVEVGVGLVKEERRKQVQAKAHLAAEERVLDALVGSTASAPTRESFRRKLRANELDDKEIELEMQAGSSGLPMFDIPGMPGASVGAINLSDMFGKAFGGRTKARRTTVREAYDPLVAEESDKLLDQDALVQEAIRQVENNGIVFLDEIDKIAGREGRMGADVSREGVQRDLLPLIEGTTVSTKHGSVKTDHILFIASGAFHVSKPSDLLPELQGRLPIRVELSPLTVEDFRRILTETEASLIKQSIALMETEGVTLRFTDDAIDGLARVAVEVNSNVENIGARRLQTVLERVLDEISFTAPDRSGDVMTIDAAYVRDRVEDLAKNADLSRFIL